MPREHVESGRIELRLNPEDKAMLARAAALARTDLTGFILRSVLPHARAVIAEAERLALSERDTAHVLALLENPPKAGARLRQAAKAGFVLAAQAGGVGLLIDAKNDEAAKWYESYNAVRLLDAPLSLVLPFATALDALNQND